MAGGRPFFFARTNSLTTFQSCVLAWPIRPSMLLLVSSRMAIWTDGAGGGEPFVVAASISKRQPHNATEATIGMDFIGFFSFGLRSVLLREELVQTRIDTVFTTGLTSAFAWRATLRFVA